MDGAHINYRRKLKRKSKFRATTIEFNVEFEMLMDDPGGGKKNCGKLISL